MNGSPHNRLLLQILGVLSCLLAGCIPRTAYEIRIDANRVKSGPLVRTEVVKYLAKLTSSNFFEHTQAAQHLIQMGPPVIPELLRNRHLLRESNDTVVPVCTLVIEIIFSRQTREWVGSQLGHPVPEIREIAAKDLERRAREEKEE